MKRIKLAAIALAVLFVGLSSFNKENTLSHRWTQSNGFFYSWFVYDGYGDPFDPYSYWISLLQPPCNSSDGYLCAVYVEFDLFTFQPTDYGLWSLAVGSGCFTQPYNGPDGKVRLEN